MFPPAWKGQKKNRAEKMPRGHISWGTWSQATAPHPWVRYNLGPFAAVPDDSWKTQKFRGMVCGRKRFLVPWWLFATATFPAVRQQATGASWFKPSFCRHMQRGLTHRHLHIKGLRGCSLQVFTDSMHHSGEFNGDYFLTWRRKNKFCLPQM